jgi:amidase
MVPIADGSDLGGSQRIPASFCNVVGLRPSWGRVPAWPRENAWETVQVEGPMARNVGDLALLLSVMAGPDPRVPTALADDPSVFADPMPGDPRAVLSGLRVGLSLDLGGAWRVDPEVGVIVRAAGEVLGAAGAIVDPAYPDLSLAEDTFRTLRAWHFQARLGHLLAEHPELFKVSLAENIRAGEHLSGADVARAHAQRTTLTQEMLRYFAEHDVLVLPTTQVPPFPADCEYPSDVDGHPVTAYLDWVRSTYFISVTGCPAISVPAGFTEGGLPVGVQLVAPPNAERRLLEVAAAFEALTRVGERRPPEPSAGESSGD